MNWENYKELAEKTLSTEFHCGKKEELLLHAVVGIITELEELINWSDDVNKGEEVADIFWYISILDRELNLNLSISEKEYLSISDDKHKKSNNDLILESYKKSSILLDSLKKKLYYNKQIDFDKFSKTSKELFKTISSFCDSNKIEISEILDKNIAKLKARYGDKFSSDKAINRNINIEREILEK